MIIRGIIRGLENEQCPSVISTVKHQKLIGKGTKNMINAAKVIFRNLKFVPDSIESFQYIHRYSEDSLNQGEGKDSVELPLRSQIGDRIYWSDELNF